VSTRLRHEGPAWSAKSFYVVEPRQVLKISVALKNFMITGNNEYLKNGVAESAGLRLMYADLLNHEGRGSEEGLKKNLPMEIVLIPMKKLIPKISKSRSWIYAAMNEKSPTHDALFPKPVRLGRRSICFVLSEVEFWLQSRIAASRAVQ